MAVVNTQDYYDTAKITTIKSFIVQAIQVYIIHRNFRLYLLSFYKLDHFSAMG
jgi:hypothetical protein